MIFFLQVKYLHFPLCHFFFKSCHLHKILLSVSQKSLLFHTALPLPQYPLHRNSPKCARWLPPAILPHLLNARYDLGPTPLGHPPGPHCTRAATFHTPHHPQGLGAGQALKSHRRGTHETSTH